VEEFTPPFHNQIRALIQRAEERFAGILSNKHKLGSLESSRNLGWRRMLNMMGRRSRQSRTGTGIVRAEPYTASETEKPVSSLGTERSPNKTRGR